MYSKDSKRNRLSEKRMERVAVIGKYWLQGKSFRTIAEVCGVSIAQVQRDVRLAKQAWKEATMATLEGLLTVELARIDQIEAEAWRGWYKSQETTTEVLRERSKGADGASTRKQVKKRQQVGLPDFLRIALSCVEQRAKILTAIKEENGESDDIVVQAVEVIVDNREQAQQMLEFEDFRKIVKQ